MHKLKFARMEGNGPTPIVTRTILAIAHNGQSTARQLYADLMTTPRFEHDRHQAKGTMARCGVIA